MNLVDVLAVGAHPDDVELGCGGTLLALKARGHRFAIVDCTAGEKGSRGDAATRAAEAKAAAESLGASGRACLGLPDTALADTDGAVRLMVEEIRKWRPKLVIGHDGGDRHPDHAAAARIVRRAAFLSALANYEAPGAPHRFAHTNRAAYAVHLMKSSHSTTNEKQKKR